MAEVCDEQRERFVGAIREKTGQKITPQALSLFGDRRDRVRFGGEYLDPGPGRLEARDVALPSS
jgi:hypothetical protein